MIPNIYVAGASKELDRCKHWIKALADEGFRITCDWTKAVEKYGSQGDGLTDPELRMFARQDLRGVDEAHVLWVLAPQQSPSKGAWIEFGYALGTKKRIVISPPVSDSVIFAKLLTVTECKTDQDAFDWIQKCLI